MSFAPIALSTYSRLSHLRLTIEALKANTLASESDLFIFSDAAKAGDEKKVKEVRKYIDGINGFKNLSIIERTVNSRVRNNRDGISQLLEKYGKCIYLEEDIVTAPGFLKFMNEALNVFEKEDRIFSISGYSPPIEIPTDYRSDIFILRRACAWGMGIWHDRFKKIKYLDNTEVQDRFAARKEIKKLCEYGDDLIRMVLLDAAGKMDALDVKIFYYQFLNEKYTIYPKKSLARNIGHDGTGVHCSQTNKFAVDLWEKLEFELNRDVKLDDRIVKSNNRFRKIARTSDFNEKSNYSVLKHMSDTNTLGDNLIFLISQPRAGSTLLHRILGGHSDVQTIAESWIMLHPLYALKQNGLLAEYDSNLARQGLEDFVSQVPEGLELYIDAVRLMGNRLYNRVLQESGKKIFLDKTPRYYLIIPELKKVFPKAKFIILLRNPLAVLSSTLNTWFKNDLHVLKNSPNYLDIVNGPKYLVQGIQYLKDSATIVKYEELVRNPEFVVKAICSKLGISFQREMLNYGDKPKPRGRFGDPVGIYQHSKAVTDNIDKWQKNLSSPALLEFADQYLKALGSDIVQKMGYNFDELKQKLDSNRQRCHSHVANFEKVRLLNKEGESLFEKGKLDDALRKLQEAFDLDPYEAETNKNMGVIYHHQGKNEKALAHYQKATELMPENNEFQRNLANFYKINGNLQQALKIYRSVLKKDPADLEVLLSLAIVSIDLGKYDDSFIFSRKALEISPANVAVRDAFVKLGEKIKLSGNLNKARECYLYYLVYGSEDEQIKRAWENLRDTEADKQIISKVKAAKKEYLVSAIVSTYNSEEFIGECLENLESQTINKDLEIVVVDASSAQNEEKIVKQFQQRYPNITYIRTRSRIGIYAAWNIAIAEACGKYCISASANDSLRKDACEILARYLDENPNCMLVYGDTYLTKTPHQSFESNTSSGTYRWPPYSFQEHLQKCLVGPHPMWHKKVHLDIGYFDEKYFADGDQEFWLRIGEKFKIAHIPEFIGLQWITDEAISRKGLLPHLEVLHIHSLYQKRFSKISARKERLCSIIIPVCNKVEFTKQCVEALNKNTPKELFELIIVDNNSTDGTKAFLFELQKDIKVISNQENLGFAKACNQGAKEASGKYLVFLNNDTVTLPGWLEAMIESANSDLGVGIVGSKLLYPDGSIQHAGIGFVNGIPDHPLRNLPADHPEANVLKEIDMVTGACLLIKRDLFFELGGFDEQFKNGVEDIDLCLKVRLKGYKVIYNPKSTLYHYEGKTPGRFDHVKENLEIFFSRWGHYFDKQGKFIGQTENQKILIKWEGSQFVNHSLALVNRELCIELAKRPDTELSLIPYEAHEFGPQQDPARFGLIAERLQKPLSGPADFHVRHQWPPNFTPPVEGHWIMIQPWEFGALPKDWVQPMETLVDELWVPSKHVRDVYIRSGISASKVFVIPNGVNHDQFNPQAAGFNLDTNKRFKFLFVGGTIKRKGIDVLLSAYREAFTCEDDVCLVIKDMGAKSFYRGQNASQMIEDIIKDPTAPEILYLTETLDTDQIAGLYTACNCLVHPYRGEGFGLPVAEAMACGLPVIVTRGGACDDFCSDANAYLIDGKVRPAQVDSYVLNAAGWLLEPDQSHLVEMLKFVYRNPDQAREKGAVAARQIRNRADWKMSADLIMERLRILKRRPVRRFAGSKDPQTVYAAKTPLEIYQKIQQSMNHKNPQEVIDELERLAGSYPQFALAHNDLGVLYYHTGDKEKARRYYERAVELMPDNINFQKNLADLYCIELGRIEEALKIYVEILKTHPQDVETLLATGQICKALEQPEDAREFFTRVLEIEPWNVDARRLVEELQSRSYEACLNPETAEDAYGRLQEKLNTLTSSDAIVELEKLVESHPDFAIGHNDLGVLYYNSGNKEKALRHYRQAARLQPENITLQKNLADFLFVEEGRVEEALQIYVNILTAHPHDVETLLITGHICVALKRFDDAREFYERVLALAPDNKDANKNLQALIVHQSGRLSARPDPVNDGNASNPPVESADLNSETSEKQQAEPKTTVSIVISLDAVPKIIKECLKSIQTHTQESYEVLLVNGGADKGLVKWAQQIAKENGHCHIIACNRQSGWAESLNRAIREASGDMIVLMHNDAVLPQGWLEAIKMCFNLEPQTGIVGPVSNRTAGVQKMFDADESDRLEFESAAKAFYAQNQYRRVPNRKLSGFFLAFGRNLPENIGYFDEQFASEEAAVEDFCNRSAAGDYQNLIAADTYVYHYERHPVKKNAAKKNSAGAEDQKKCKEKWNGIQNPQAKSFQAELFLEQANEFSQKGSIDRALEIMLNAIRVQPEEKRLYLGLAEILVAAKRFQDAKDALNEIPSSNGDPEIKKVILLGYAEEGLGNYESAMACTQRVLAMRPNHAQALNLNGILAYRSNDRSCAENFFKQAIASDPGYGEPYTNLAMLRLEAEQPEEALALFEKGFILSPTDLDIATNYHAFIEAHGDFEKAEKLARQAAGLYPLNQKIKYMLIDFLIRQENYEAAMPEIEDAIIKFGIADGILGAALKVREKLGPMTIDRSSKKAPVSLCMIIKDEEKYLARCLASVKPIVDEMIVVDTGSTDRSKDIAVTFGARVYDYQWRDDFAAARNYSISRASGEWILILDGDEMISPRDHADFNEIVKKLPRAPIAYSIVTRNYNKLANIVGWVPNDGQYPEEEATFGWLPSEKVRLFYGKDQIRFEGAVHEMVDPLLRRNGIEIKKCRIPVHHYGRLDKEKLGRKGEIYFDIGQKKLCDRGEDIRALWELAIQASVLEKNEQALELWQRLLAQNPDPKLAANAYVNIGNIYNRLGKFEEALDAGKKAVAHDPNLKEAQYNHALAELQCGNATRTIGILEDLLNRFPDYPPAQFILSAAYCCAGLKEKGLDGIQKLKNTPLGAHLEVPCFELAQSLVAAKRMEYALPVLAAAIECDIVNKEILDLFTECIQTKDKSQKLSQITLTASADRQLAECENSRR